MASVSHSPGSEENLIAFNSEVKASTPKNFSASGSVQNCQRSKPNRKNRSESKPTLKDLSGDDKKKVAELIQEIARLSETNDVLTQKLKAANTRQHDDFLLIQQEKEKLRESFAELEKQQEQMKTERANLQKQYQECQRLLEEGQKEVVKQQDGLLKSFSGLLASKQVTATANTQTNNLPGESVGLYVTPELLQDEFIKDRFGDGKLSRSAQRNYTSKVTAGIKAQKVEEKSLERVSDLLQEEPEGGKCRRSVPKKYSKTIYQSLDESDLAAAVENDRHPSYGGHESRRSLSAVFHGQIGQPFQDGRAVYDLRRTASALPAERSNYYSHQGTKSDVTGASQKLSQDFTCNFDPLPVADKHVMRDRPVGDMCYDYRAKYYFNSPLSVGEDRFNMQQDTINHCQSFPHLANEDGTEHFQSTCFHRNGYGIESSKVSDEITRQCGDEFGDFSFRKSENRIDKSPEQMYSLRQPNMLNRKVSSKNVDDRHSEAQFEENDVMKLINEQQALNRAESFMNEKHHLKQRNKVPSNLPKSDSRTIINTAMVNHRMQKTENEHLGFYKFRERCLENKNTDEHLLSRSRGALARGDSKSVGYTLYDLWDEEQALKKELLAKEKQLIKKISELCSDAHVENVCDQKTRVHRGNMAIFNESGCESTGELSFVVDGEQHRKMDVKEKKKSVGKTYHEVSGQSKERYKDILDMFFRD